MKCRVVVILGLCFATSMVDAQTKSRRHGFVEATEDGDCSGAASVSAGVIKAILRTEPAKGYDGPDVRSLFRATKIQLGANGEAGLLVCGKGHMTGADNEWYWIVASPETQPRVVLFTGSLSVGLLGSSHHGYRDVRSSWNSAADGWDATFRYNGTRYVRTQQHCYDLSKGHFNPNKVKCP